MTDTIIENAIIIKADIHRIVSKESGLNLSLGFDYGIHERTKEFPKIIYRKVPTWRWIMHCMEVAHASKWSDMKGKAVKVKIKGGTIEAIGDIIGNWSWLDFSEKEDEVYP